MTDGNTQKVDFAYPPQNSDGWDVTHKAIYLWNTGSPVFSNITIDSLIIQDFKAENIYSGGSAVTGMVIQNSTLTNFNGDGISIQAADLKVLNNTISNGSIAGIENSTTSTGSSALVHQLYQCNTISQFPQEGLQVLGADFGIAAGSVDILNNTFDTIAQFNPGGTASAVNINSQIINEVTTVPPANVKFSGNICHDCNTFGIFQTSGNTAVQGNTFTVDQYKASSVFTFEYKISGVTFSSNSGGATANAFSKNLTVGAVYVIYSAQSGIHHWNNAIVRNNTWSFPNTPLGAATPQYQFVTSNGGGWSVVGMDNINWQGDQCSGCSHADANHGLVNLSQTLLIEPYGPTVYVNGNTSAVTATIDTTKEEDGAEVEIVNAGVNPVSFVSDGNLSLPFTYTLRGVSSASLKLSYSAAAGKFILGNAAATVVASAGTPQSAVANTNFATQLQVTVTDGNHYPVSGAAVTFSVPASGASAAFTEASTALVSTNANGIATAPTLTANGQAGAYTVMASVAGVGTTAGFSLTNVAGAAAGVFVLAGTPQSATVSTAFAMSLQAVVKDANSNPLSGITVTFSAPTIGASAGFGGLGAATAVTNGDGIATAPALTANAQAGSYTVSASVPGAGLAATFNLTNVINTNGVGLAVNFSSGFGTPAGMQLNGSAKWNASTLELTDGGPSEAGSSFYTTPVNVASFTTSFTFQQTGAQADGMMFVIQNAPTGAAALGGIGGFLGFSPAISNSVGVKFDLYNNSGEGINSTGLYLKGALPMTPAQDMTASGVNLHNGDPMAVTFTYDGTMLSMSIVDTVTNSTYSTSLVNIPLVLGATKGFIGFTAGTGGATAVQQILSWTYSITAPTAAAPAFSPGAGTYANAQSVTISEGTFGASIYYTTDGSTPTASSNVYVGPISVTVSETLRAIATAPGYNNSPVTTAAYVINTNGLGSDGRTDLCGGGQ